MFNLLLLFALTFAISFAGSVHPGPVNLSVVQATLRRGRRVGLLLAVGGCVPEIFYGLLAVQGVRFFEQQPGLFQILKITVVPLLFGLGVATLLRRPKPGSVPANKPPVSPGQRRLTLGQGVLLALLNPQLLPFWLVILVWYNSNPMLRVRAWPEQTAFVAGAALGAFAALYLLAQVVYSQRSNLDRLLRPDRVDAVLGWGFIVLALGQAINLLFFGK